MNPLNWHAISTQAWVIVIALVIGFVLSYISAYYVVKAFISFVSNNGFGIFAWYRIVAGSILLAFISTAWVRMIPGPGLAFGP